MEIKNKLSLVSVVFATLLLAACGGDEATDEAAGGAGDMGGASTTAPVAAEPAAAAPAAAEPAAAEMATVYYFDFDQSTLTDQTRADLDTAAAALKASGASFRLEGHADERGTNEYNLALGERRAEAVKNYLGLQGVDTSKIEVISYGEEKPVMTGSDEASWAKNRRVELVK